ncbi:MAG: hypothetical protein V1787_02530 [Candidatus Micrarchaeota archaeon]
MAAGPFVEGARRKWNASDALERAFVAGEARQTFKSMGQLRLQDVVGLQFDALDNATALRIAEIFWINKASR